MANQLCYCAHPLKHDAEVPDSRCCNCCKEISPESEEAIYTCFDQNCIYRKLVGGHYYVCQDCYEEDDAKKDLNENNKMEFILNKFICSINSIS